MITFIQDLFDLLAKEKIPFVFIRPKTIAEPNIYHGDFDLLVKPEAINPFFSLVHQHCSETGFNFVLTRRKADKSNLIIYSSDGEKSVEFDIWSELDIKDKALAKSTYISWEKLESSGKIKSTPEGYLLEDDFAGLYYLSHLLSKKKDTDKQEVKERLDYFRALPQLSDTTRELLSAPNSDKMKRANTALSEQGLLSSSSLNRFRKGAYRTQKNLAKNSGILTVVGPDGVGKTTIINELESLTKARYFRFKKLFRKAFSYKLLLKLKMKAWERWLDQELAKNQFDDLECEKLFTISLFRGYILAARSRLGKKRIIDRYYSDLLIQGSRFEDREITLVNNAEARMKRAPVPACVLQLDAPSEVILSRKKELSADAIDSFRTLYFKLALVSGTPKIIYLNTQHSIDDTRSFLNKVNIGF